MIKPKSYFIFKGVASYDMGIIVTRMTDIVKPLKRVAQITIPGRNGVLHDDEGTYENYTKDIECAIINSRQKTSYDEIISWLDGRGNLIVSVEPDKVYRAAIINQIPISGVIKSFSSFLVQFDVYPFKYSVNAADDFIILAAAKSIYNRGTYYSEPIITVYGSEEVTLTINGMAYTLSDVDGYVTINSEIQEVYKDSVNKNNTFTADDFPKLAVGKNDIAFAGSVTKIEIQPNWRWL